MNRRSWLKTLLGSSVLGMTGIPQLRASTGDIIKPQRLRRGMRVGLVAPSSPPREAEGVRYGIEVLQSFGFEVVEGDHLWERDQYLAGSDRQRADDVNDMFRRSDIGGIFCLRGGYGTSRILPLLDYEAIRENPKIITGFSDISGLVLAIYARTGLVTFHGPVAQQGFSDYTLAEFRKVMMEPAAPVTIAAPPPFEAGEGKVESRNRLTRFVGGRARGRLIGGNLSLVSNLIGTPFEPDFRDCILFLEDVDEAPYRIDRMLTQLWLAGKLQQVAGVALGKFSRADDDKNTFSLEEVFEQRFVPLGVPAIRGLMIGHVTDRASVPLGIEAELDADAGTLTLLEAAVT